MRQTTKSVSFALGEHERSFISDMIENGRFVDTTDVVRAGLRLLEDYEFAQKLKRLRTLIVEGDMDIEQGRTRQYENPGDLMDSILNRKDI